MGTFRNSVCFTSVSYQQKTEWNVPKSITRMSGVDSMTCLPWVWGFPKKSRGPHELYRQEAAEGIHFCYPYIMDSLLARITIDPLVCHGKPCVRGLRYPVEVLLELLSSGMTHEEVLADYQDLEREDLLAVLAYAARLAQTRRLQPLNP